MNDGVKPQPQESQEFENLEKAQPTVQQPQQKPQETFNVKDEVGQAI